MKIEKLTLRNFRNIAESTIYPSKNINFLSGGNGQGKTSVIEAIGFLSTLQSFRDSKPPAVVRWGALQSEINCIISTEEAPSVSPWRTELRMNFQRVDPSDPTRVTKIAYINSKPFKSSLQYLSQRLVSSSCGFHSVIFNPSDHDLVRGDPSTRRAYMDRAISATNVVYLKSLRRYHRVLLQRNLLLKSQENRSSNLYQSYTEQLCKYGILIMRERLQWIKRLNAVLPKILKSFAPEQSPIDLEYESGCLSYARESTQAFLVKNKELDSNTLGTLGPLSDSEQLPSLELLEQLFLARVSSLEVAEWKTGCSLVGPHRDDWVFYLDSHKLKGHASQGEVRSALLALKLAEVKLFQNETGYSPIFLLDDFSSELDGERRSFLMQFLVQTGLQTFITSTEDAFAVGKRYWMSSGVIEEGSHDN